MNPIQQLCAFPAAVLLACILLGPQTLLQAQTNADPARTNSIAAAVLRLEPSPVDIFRKLLPMNADQLQQQLTNYPPDKRDQILLKIEEYRMLPVDFCELRLRVTELRWYLVPLLKAPREQRETLLLSVPEPYRAFIADRLQEWDLWPLGLKDEVLEYETTMRYFGDTNAEVQRQAVLDELPAQDRPAIEQKLAEWRSLPDEQRRQLYGAFRHYFELNETEQQKILDALFQPERQQTEKVVHSIDQWPKPQQDAYLAALRKFAEMSAAERRAFMKNARRWQKMSPAEQQAWRDLVQQIQRARSTGHTPASRAIPTAPTHTQP